MPSVKDFKKNQKATKPQATEELVAAADGSQSNSSNSNPNNKRRPGREKATEPTEVGETLNTETVSAGPVSEASSVHSSQDAANAESDKKKIEISFFGSEIIRAKLPKPFEIAETVATDWMNDGNFEDLSLGHPLAESAAIAGLKKAKELEKKVIDSGVIERVAMQALTAGLKAQSEINNIREQVKAKFGKK